MYVPSETVLFNVGAKPALGTLTAWRKNAKTVKVHFNLSERSTVTVAVTKGSKRLVSYTRTRAAGGQTLTLHLGSAAPKSSSIKVKVTAVDSWGRATVKSLVIAKGH